MIDKVGSMGRMPTDFGKRVKDARRHAKLNQRQLAAAVGVSQSNISQIESSAYESAFTVQIAIACEVDAVWLATGEGDMTPTAKASSAVIRSMPAPRGIEGALAEVQAAINGLSPLLQDAGRGVMIKWLNGQATLEEAGATLKKLQQASAGDTPDAENRVA